MVNYTNYPIKENIKKTKAIVQFAVPLGISVESEIIYNKQADNVNNDTNLIEQATFLEIKITSIVFFLLLLIVINKIKNKI